MSLSNSVRTHLIDPAVHNTQRSEFRLSDAFWASSFRLIDLGVYDTQVTANTGLVYPSINGVMASVKKLTLYSGGTVIDEIQELPAWASIQHLKTSNQGSEDINRFELLNGMGLSLSNDSWTFNDIKKDYAQKNVSGTSVGRTRHHNQFQVAPAADNKTSGAVTLADYLGLLQSNPVLPMIPNLKLVVDWNTNEADYYQDPDAGTAVAAPNYVPIRPTLIADELVGAEGQGGDFKLNFLANVVERFVVPATSGSVGDQTRSSFRSSAFKNRFTKDLTFFNKVTANDGWVRAKERSPAQRGEIIQLIVNGAKYLPDQGINQEAQKLQYFNDTMGSLNLPSIAYYEGLLDTSGRVISATDKTNNPSSNLVGNYSVTAVRIENVIDRLDVEYTRQHTGTAAKDALFTLLCFGRCAKMLEVKNGQLRISY